MGRKSRLKRERRNNDNDKAQSSGEEFQGKTPLLARIVRWGVYISLFTPLVVSNRFFFPYVGPKGLFFMALAEIIFFLWLFLIIHYPRYRPKLNTVLVAIVLFIIALTISSIQGVDFSRSFWSKHERMSGLLMHFHLFGYFLALSSTFKSWEDWKKIFSFTGGVATIISLIFLLGEAGVNLPRMINARGGATLGNSSFLGTYLLFNAFLVLIVILKSKKNWRIITGIGLAIILLALIVSTARAAKFSFFGGLYLLALFYLIFRRPETKFKIAGILILLISTIVALYLVFYPGSFVHEEVLHTLGTPRLIVWEQGWKAFKDKPLFGWGPENFVIVFSEYYNSYKPIAGGAPWFDRAHNIVFDSLATIGGIGFLAYLGMLGSVFIVAIKRFLKRNKFWIPGVLTVLMISYFIQNLTVFDMPASFMMLFLTLAYTGSLDSKKREIKKKVINTKYWAGLLLILVFCATFFLFVVQPVRGGMMAIKSITTIPRSNTIINIAQKAPNQLGAYLKSNSQRRIELYEKTLETSPLGKYQARSFLAGRSQSFLQKHSDLLPKSTIKNELDSITSMLEKTRKESPKDLKSALTLSQIYGFYSLIDPQKTSKAIEVGKETIGISPTHQRSYWALAQTYLYHQKFDKAIQVAKEAKELEPRCLRSHQVLLRAAKMSGDQKKIRKFGKEASEIGMKELERRRNLSLEDYRIVLNFSQAAGNSERVKKVAKKGLEVGFKKMDKKEGYLDLGTYQLIGGFAQVVGDSGKLGKIAGEGLKAGLKKIEESKKSSLNTYKLTVTFAQVVGNTQKAKEIAQKAVDQNSSWKSEFKNILKTNGE